jgi:phage/plasmid-like protein (TIGR03299 family)
MIANQIKVAGSSIDEVLESANMHWIAEQHEIFSGSGVSIPNHKALIRSDNNHVLGIVGKKYEPIQNFQAFSFLDEIVKANKAKYEYLYTVDGGAKIIVQAKIDSSFEVRKGDQIDTYITMMNSFDGKMPLRAFFTSKRLFCLNQLRGAIKHKFDSVSIRHTKNMVAKVEEAFKVLGMAEDYFVSFKEHAKAMAQKALDKKMIDKMLNEVMGEKESTRTENQKDEIVNLINSGKGNNGSSIWDFYNGIVEYSDHFRVNDEEKRLANNLVGSGLTLKEKAWEVSLKNS